MQNFEVIEHHVVFGSKTVPTATLDVVVNGERKQVVANDNKEPLEALHKALLKAFGYRVESWLITTAQKGNNGVLDELTLVIFGNDKRYVACEQFPLGPERSELYEATINLYLRALREQKQPKSTY